ncbi:remorin-like [Wolffia australiana]
MGEEKEKTEATPAAEPAVEKQAEAPAEKADDSKALVVAEAPAPDPTAEKGSSSIDRDTILARVESEKKESLLKAWEENEKAKVENKAHKKLSGVSSWEKTEKAKVEAELTKLEESFEKKKAEYAEKKKNKVAAIHKAAEEKKALIEAQKGEALLKVDELSAKYRIKGFIPKKLLGCF